MFTPSSAPSSTTSDRTLASDMPTDTTLPVYSAFGTYQPLPVWSSWCSALPMPSDKIACTEQLQRAVENQTPYSRNITRKHAWQLWAAMSSPLNNSGYDASTYTSNKFGTTGCWHKGANNQQACSGVFPLWLSWPNTGVPYQTGERPAPINHPNLLNNSRNFSVKLNNTNVNGGKRDDNSVAISNAIASTNSDKNSYPNPTQIQTVNTADPETPIPTYLLPPLVIVKQCGVDENSANSLMKTVHKWQLTATSSKQEKALVKAWTAVKLACSDNGVNNIICPSQGICDGNAFVNQGDVMIASESMTEQAWQAIQKNKLYHNGATLQKLYDKGDPKTAANQVANWIDNKFISTKHMYWPVKGCKPGGKASECKVRYGALPPWVPKKFSDKNFSTNASYLGYEKWEEVIAIDTCEQINCYETERASLTLSGVINAEPIITENPDVYSIRKFSHLQVSAETLNTAFTATDRALLDQATIWAYGEASNGFEAGDFLVVIAMHITTKEIDTWGFQSVWWSPMNDELSDCPIDQYNHCYGQKAAYGAMSPYAGLNTATIATLDGHAGTTWRNNYLMIDSYGIRYEIDGEPTNIRHYFPDDVPKWTTQRPSGEQVDLLPVAMNVYIEPVIHPLGTNCQNCHRRAGISAQAPKKKEYAKGVGRTNYQTAQCASLLADYGMPAQDSCMTAPWAWNDHINWDTPGKDHCIETNGTQCKNSKAYPIVNTDLSWFIADGHVQSATPLK